MLARSKRDFIRSVRSHAVHVKSRRKVSRAPIRAAFAGKRRNPLKRVEARTARASETRCRAENERERGRRWGRNFWRLPKIKEMEINSSGGRGEKRERESGDYAKESEGSGEITDCEIS